MNHSTAPEAAHDIEALYHTHVRPIYGFVFAKVGNREAAEDITSEVFLKALAHVDVSRDARSIAAWLYRVARNVVNDYWRVQSAAQVIELDEARMARTAAPAQDHAREDRTTRWAAAIMTALPETYRAVLQHRLLEGLSVAETARLLGLSETNVKVIQHRALKRAADMHDLGTTDER